MAERGTAPAQIAAVMSLDQALVDAALVPPSSLRPQEFTTAQTLAEKGVPPAQIAQLLAVDEKDVRAVLSHTKVDNTNAGA